MPLLAAALILLAAGWRVLALHAPSLGNFTPLMALAFCGGAYFRDWRLWIVPFAALVLSDLAIDRYYAAEYGYHWAASGALVRFACFAAGLLIGQAVARRRSWSRLIGGSLAASLSFYLVTNTASWWSDAGYAHDAAGWLQALTVGHPQYPSTFYFFRNTLASDLLFTAAFSLALEYAALKRGAPSLLARKREA